MIAEPLLPLAVPIDQLNLDPANARTHDRRNLDVIKASLVKFGQRTPIVVQRQGMVVRAGNARLIVARELGWTEIAAVLVDEGDVEATAYALADNRAGELSAWDAGALLGQLRTLDGAGFATADFAFDPKELRDLEAQVPMPEVVEDQAPAPPDVAITQPGDLWILGNHRLLCGDSASTADLDRLLDGQPIHLCNTDPPYNVKVEPRSNNAIAAGLSSCTSTHHQGLDLARHPEKASPTHAKLRPKDRRLASDFVSDEDFEKMLAAWFGNIARVLLPGHSAYIWGGDANIGNYPPVLKACGLYFSQAVIWDKEHPVLTRKDFMLAHEWCFYCWKEGAAHRFFGPNNATALWRVKKVNPQSMIHLTEKPVELAARAMKYSSVPGENVLDLFGGSGSTLIAAEQLERRAFLMELDPLYCDVIIQRWEAFASRKAERQTAALDAKLS